MRVDELYDTFFSFGKARSYYYRHCYVDRVENNVWYIFEQPYVSYHPPCLRLLYSESYGYIERERLQRIISEWCEREGVTTSINVERYLNRLLVVVHEEDRSHFYLAENIELVPENGRVVVRGLKGEAREAIPDYIYKSYFAHRIYIAKYGVLYITTDMKLFKKRKDGFIHEVTLEEVKKELAPLYPKLGPKGRKYAKLIERARSVDELVKSIEKS